MAQQIKWGTRFKEAVKLKMARGATPEQVKASFGKMVDKLQTPDSKLAAARAEIRRLKKMLGQPVVKLAKKVKE